MTWLLVLLGPVGWVLLALAGLMSGRTEFLTVLLRYEDDAWNRVEHHRRMRFIPGLGALVAGALTPTRWIPSAFAAVLVGAWQWVW